MDLDEAFPIIEGVFVEYMDSRIYQQYLFNNILLQIDGKGMSYLDYIKKNRINNSEINKQTDYKKVEHNNNELLEKFKKQGGIVQPL